AEVLNQPGYRRGRASRRKHVIHDQDALAGLDRILVNFEDIGAVLERIFHAFAGSRQFLRFPYRNKPDAERVGESGSENKAPGFNAQHQVGTGGLVMVLQSVDDALESAADLEQRRDVVEIDAWLREVG